MACRRTLALHPFPSVRLSDQPGRAALPTNNGRRREEDHRRDRGRGAAIDRFPPVRCGLGADRNASVSRRRRQEDKVENEGRVLTPWSKCTRSHAGLLSCSFDLHAQMRLFIHFFGSSYLRGEPGVTHMPALSV